MSNGDALQCASPFFFVIITVLHEQLIASGSSFRYIGNVVNAEGVSVPS